jgi:hypothetical protein
VICSGPTVSAPVPSFLRTRSRPSASLRASPTTASASPSPSTSPAATAVSDENCGMLKARSSQPPARRDLLHVVEPLHLGCSLALAQHGLHQRAVRQPVADQLIGLRHARHYRPAVVEHHERRVARRVAQGGELRKVADVEPREEHARA